MIRNILFLTISLAFLASTAHASDGIISVESNHPAKTTADRLESIMTEKGLTLFARIDHQKNAAGVEQQLRSTEVLIFGNPKVGTPLMQCAQNTAIDLPQKILVSEDAEGKVWLSYNDPQYLVERHKIEGCDIVISKISKVLSALTAAAASE